MQKAGRSDPKLLTLLEAVVSKTSQTAAAVELLQIKIHANASTLHAVHATMASTSAAAKPTGDVGLGTTSADVLALVAQRCAPLSDKLDRVGAAIDEMQKAVLLRLEQYNSHFMGLLGFLRPLPEFDPSLAAVFQQLTASPVKKYLCLADSSDSAESQLPRSEPVSSPLAVPIPYLVRETTAPSDDVTTSVRFHDNDARQVTIAVSSFVCLHTVLLTWRASLHGNDTRNARKSRDCRVACRHRPHHSARTRRFVAMLIVVAMSW